MNSFALRLFITTSYLLLLYMTLGISRDLVEPLRAAGRLTELVMAALTVGGLATIGWRFHLTSPKLIWLRIVLVAVLLGLSFLFPLPEERLHLLIYGLLGWLIAWSADGHTVYGKSRWYWYVWPVLLVWCAGAVDECIQWYLPNRVFDMRDILLNGISGMAGIVIYWTGMAEKKHAKERQHETWHDPDSG